MSIKGNLRVIVENSHLRASLLFEPNPEGQEWDLDSVLKLINSKGITNGVDKDAVSAAMEAFEKSTVSVDEKFSKNSAGTVTYTIAEGKAPIPPPGPEFRWKIRAIPDELKKDAEWVLQKAGDPHITQKRSRRVKVEKEIKKKGRFQFGKASTEKVDSWVTEEWEEQVHVDPGVEVEGWAEQGDVIAEISTSDQTGQMGQSVYGKPIAVPKVEPKKFLAGQGIEISTNGITALHDGFVRRGKNWIEILPFQYHRWSVNATRDRATCLLTFVPGKKDATPPDPEKILQAAVQKEFSSEELLTADQLRQVLLNSIHRQTPLKDYPLTESRDAWFKVEAGEDRLKGFLSVRKGGGKGRPLVLKEVGAAIKKSGFKNMDFEQIKQDLLDFYRSRRTEMNEYVLAEGVAPTRGADRSLTFQCDFENEEKLEQLRNVPLPADMGGKEAQTESAEQTEPAGEAIQSLQNYPLSSVRKMAFVKVGMVVAEITATGEGEEGTDVYGNTLPGLPGNDPSISLQENILIKGNEIVANENGILDVIEDDGLTIMRVRPYREAKIEVEVSRDRMQAYISLEGARGFAPPLTMDRVNAVLEEKQVFKGIDTEALSEAILNARGGQSIERVKIAEGNRPVKTENEGQIKFFVPLASGDKVTIKSNGRADFRTHDEITAVEKDQLIAEIPSVEFSGSEGWDVSGNPVKAGAVQQTELNVGENIRRSEEENGSVRFYAGKSGELMYDGRNISVHVYHQVNGNVDMQTGNVKFPGDVQVKGNVERGFYVVAGGEIQVAGAVEGALLSSGGSIQIAQGVIGAGKAVLRAKRNIRAQFVEESTLLAVGDIEIKNGCLRCSVKCNGVLRLFGEKGTLIGGKIYARHGLEVRNLGNDKGTRTVISFGQDYLVADQIEQHEKEIQRLKELVTSMDTQMKKYEQRGQMKSLEKVRTSKLKYLKMIEKRSLRLFTLRERYEEHFSSKIVVRGSLYPGVIVESHGRFSEIQSPRKNVTISFNQNNGRIEINDNKKEE